MMIPIFTFVIVAGAVYMLGSRATIRNADGSYLRLPRLTNLHVGYVNSGITRHHVMASIMGTMLLASFLYVVASAEPDRNDSAMAITMAQEFVRKNLKAPSTASFQECRAKRDGNEWTVRGQVDSQNGFGAMLRTDWRVKMTANGKWWKLIDIDVLE